MSLCLRNKHNKVIEANIIEYYHKILNLKQAVISGIGITSFAAMLLIDFMHRLGGGL